MPGLSVLPALTLSGSQLADALTHGARGYALWSVTPDGRGLSLEALQVRPEAWLDGGLARAGTDGRVTPLIHVTAIARALSEGVPVMTSALSDAWEPFLGPGATVTDGQGVAIPLLDDTAALGALVFAGWHPERKLIPFISSASVLHLSAMELCRRLRASLGMQHSAPSVHRLVEDLIQPLTAIIARVETLLELFTAGDDPELDRQIAELPSSAARLQMTLSGAGLEALLGPDRSSLDRCIRACCLVQGVAD